MSEMIERVATALHASAKSGVEWEELSVQSRRFVVGMARAAVAALREPTEAMVQAAKPFPAHLSPEHPDPADPWHENMRLATMLAQAEVASLYRAMIDAALEE